MTDLLIFQPMSADYVELHCHSNFSLLDGVSPPEALVTRAAALGMLPKAKRRCRSNCLPITPGGLISASADSGEKAAPFSTDGSTNHDDGWVWREYFRLVTVSERLVDMYRDMAGSGWYVQRVYD